MNNEIYAQYGCGLSTSLGWLNFDASPTLRIQRLPFMRGILEAVNTRRAAAAERFARANHGRRDNTRFRRFAIFPENARYGDIVEGLPLHAQTCTGIYCSHVLEHLSREDCQRAMDNTRRYLIPGGIFRFVLPDLEYFVRNYTDADAFMKATFLGVERRPRGLSGFVRTWLGNSAHLWMWDFKTIAHCLDLAGFKDIRRAQMGDSADPRFKQVEEASRWENCLGVECVAK